MRIILILISMMVLTACDKDVGRNIGIPTPPIFNPGTFQYETAAVLDFADHKTGCVINYSQGGKTFCDLKAKSAPLAFDGGLKIVEFINVESNQNINVFQNGKQVCLFSKFGTQYKSVFLVNGEIRQQACVFPVAKNDIISLSVDSAHNQGDVQVDVKMYHN